VLKSFTRIVLIINHELCLMIVSDHSCKEFYEQHRQRKKQAAHHSISVGW
jgi:hypothetical protein